MWVYLNIKGFLISLALLYIVYKVWMWLGCPMSGDSRNG